MLQFFGVIPSAYCDTLRTNVEACAACAVYVTRWCLHSASDACNRANLAFLPVLQLLVSLVRAATEAHPVCYMHCAEACEVSEFGIYGSSLHTPSVMYNIPFMYMFFVQAIFAASRKVLESAAFRPDQAAQESVMTLAVSVVHSSFFITANIFVQFCMVFL